MAAPTLLPKAASWLAMPLSCAAIDLAISGEAKSSMALSISRRCLSMPAFSSAACEESELTEEGVLACALCQSLICWASDGAGVWWSPVGESRFLAATPEVTSNPVKPADVPTFMSTPSGCQVVVYGPFSGKLIDKRVIFGRRPRKFAFIAFSAGFTDVQARPFS
jgi:hypothetical protein